jgi:hypothetical protein
MRTEMIQTLVLVTTFLIEYAIYLKIRSRS